MTLERDEVAIGEILLPLGRKPLARSNNPSGVTGPAKSWTIRNGQSELGYVRPRNPAGEFLRGEKMTIDLLDLLLIARFCFDKPVPAWLWIWGVIATAGASVRMEKITKALKG